MVNKLSKFQSYVYLSTHDVLVLTETRSSQAIYDKEILTTGFNIYRNDRVSCGGVLITNNNNLASKLLTTPSGLKVLIVEVQCKLTFTFCTTQLLYDCDVRAFLQNVFKSHTFVLGNYYPDINWQGRKNILHHLLITKTRPAHNVCRHACGSFLNLSRDKLFCVYQVLGHRVKLHWKLND